MSVILSKNAGPTNGNLDSTKTLTNRRSFNPEAALSTFFFETALSTFNLGGSTLIKTSDFQVTELSRPGRWVPENRSRPTPRPVHNSASPGTSGDTMSLGHC